MEIDAEINGESYVLVFSATGREGVALDKRDDPIAEITNATNQADCKRKLIAAIKRSE